MKNYIISNYRTTKLVLTTGAVDNLKKYTPRGCPFINYTMLDLLNDLVQKYSWKMEPGRTYSIKHFLELTNDAHAITYKSGLLALIND